MWRKGAKRFKEHIKTLLWKNIETLTIVNLMKLQQKKECSHRRWLRRSEQLNRRAVKLRSGDSALSLPPVLSRINNFPLTDVRGEREEREKRKGGKGTVPLFSVLSEEVLFDYAKPNKVERSSEKKQIGEKTSARSAVYLLFFRNNSYLKMICCWLIYLLCETAWRSNRLIFL